MGVHIKTVERLAYRMDEAAQALGVSRSKIYEMANRGQIPVIHAGSSLRVPVAALNEWIQRQLGAAIFSE